MSTEQVAPARPRSLTDRGITIKIHNPEPSEEVFFFCEGVAYWQHYVFGRGSELCAVQDDYPDPKSCEHCAARIGRQISRFACALVRPTTAHPNRPWKRTVYPLTKGLYDTCDHHIKDRLFSVETFSPKNKDSNSRRRRAVLIGHAPRHTEQSFLVDPFVALRHNPTDPTAFNAALAICRTLHNVPAIDPRQFTRKAVDTHTEPVNTEVLQAMIRAFTKGELRVATESKLPSQNVILAEDGTPLSAEKIAEQPAAKTICDDIKARQAIKRKGGAA